MTDTTNTAAVVAAPETRKPLRWEDLFTLGVLVVLHVGAWCARAALSSRDLGLTAVEAKAADKAIYLGAARLAPAKAFAEINAAQYKAEAALRAAGIPFRRFDSCFFVANDRLEPVLAALATAQVERNEAVERFCAGYAAMRDAALPVVETSLRAVAKDSEIAERAIARMRAEYPSVEKVRESFTMDFDTLTINSPTAEQAKAAAAAGVKEITSTVGGMVKSLRDDLIEKIAAVVEQAKKGGKLHGKTINSTKAALSRAADLNRLIQDTALATQIDVLGALLDSEDVEAAEKLIPALEAAKVALTADVEAATAKALDTLTSTGRRVIG
jgi:hypothetical protein